MDPKSLSHLDPKMRETYERIMGTAVPAAPSSPAPAEAPVKADAPTDEATSAGPSIFSSSPSNIAAADTSAAPAGPTPPPSPAAQPVSPTPYHVAETVATPTAPDAAQPAMQPLPSPAAVAQMSKATNAGPLLRILYILGAVIFFVIYTVFWIKIFNLPFLF